MIFRRLSGAFMSSTPNQNNESEGEAQPFSSVSIQSSLTSRISLGAASTSNPVDASAIQIHDSESEVTR
jgi:hypothetical protein